MKLLLLVLALLASTVAVSADNAADEIKKISAKDTEYFVGILEHTTLSDELRRDIEIIAYNRIFRLWYYEQEGVLDKINEDFFGHLFNRFRNYLNSRDIYFIDINDPLTIEKAFEADGTLWNRLPTIKDKGLLVDIDTLEKYEELVSRFQTETKITQPVAAGQRR